VTRERQKDLGWIAWETLPLDRRFQYINMLCSHCPRTIRVSHVVLPCWKDSIVNGCVQVPEAAGHCSCSDALPSAPLLSSDAIMQQLSQLPAFIMKTQAVAIVLCMCVYIRPSTGTSC
jgi:hypothetical protein